MITGSPQFAISIPQFAADGTFDPASFRAYLSRAEELGFHSGWAAEQVLGSMPLLGPAETLSYAAACTDRLRLGCAVFVTPLHSPLHLAKSISSLDQLSRGRLEVGIGTGGGFRPFPAFGVDGRQFVSRFTEGLELMRAMWTQDRVDFDGRFWQVHGGAMEPKPFQKPYPPVWFGGSHPDALRRAVRLAGGFMGAGSTTTADFTGQARVVAGALAEQGRDPATFRVAKRVYLGVDDDPARARRRTGEALSDLYGYFGLKGIERVGVAGRPGDVAAGLAEIAAAGAGLILLNPLFDEAEQMERLAAEVIPRLA